LQGAIAAHKSTIAAETLVARWSDGPFEDGFVANEKIDSQPLEIRLKRA
jgi:hypothetical protein